MSKPKYMKKGKGDTYAICIHAENLFLYLTGIYYNNNHIPAKYRHLLCEKLVGDAIDMCTLIEEAMHHKPKHKKTCKKKIAMLEEAKEIFERLHTEVLLSYRITDIQISNHEYMADLFAKLTDAFTYTLRNMYSLCRKLPTRKEYREISKKINIKNAKRRELNMRWRIEVDENDRDSDGFIVLRHMIRDKQGFIRLQSTPKHRKEMDRLKIRKKHVKLEPKGKKKD